MQKAMLTASQHQLEIRPLSSRAITEPEHIPSNSSLASPTGAQRNNSEHHVSLSLSGMNGHSVQAQTSPTSPLSHMDLKNSILSSNLSPSRASSIPSPPLTPSKWSSNTSTKTMSYAKDTYFDFSRIDYELERARCIGRGLWSSVYFASPVTKSLKASNDGVITPPTTPQKTQPTESSPCRLFAIKSPAQPDAANIFSHEARILTRLQDSSHAQQFIVPFHGMDPRNSCLVFEGVIGGSLEDLFGRIQNMTEFARHLELRQIFPGLASDLIRGLDFIHSAGIIHADIKPANLMLDIVDDNLPRSVLRARYIDFSASFIRGEGGSANAGGTWDFMAPEQLRIQKELNEPTFASDVWSVGITLLSLIAGGSPYTAACGSNIFMRREAIKSGDPLSFAQMEPVVHRRITACQDFIDCCRLALQKDRERRCTAASWETWVRQQGFVYE